MAILEPRSRRRKLTAILHADVVGFSRLMGEDETGTHQALGELRRVVDPLITAHGGRIVGTAGDSLLADFSSVVDALNCAIEMQRAARAINNAFPPERRLELRIGINVGDVIVDGDNIFGDGVNIAARLEALAQPGTTCISQTVYDHVKNKLDLDYRPLGSHRVKNIAQPVRAYAVGLPAKSPRPRRGRQPLIAAVAATIALMIAGLVAWEVYSGAGRALLGLGAAPKAVDVASLAAPNRLAGRTSVAVLPFKNLSGDVGQDYFSDGITEDVIGALGRFSSLLVAAKSASFQFKGRDIAPAEIGRALDARYLLGGSVRRAGDRVRVNVELTDAETGRHLWSEAYDAELTDIFAVQDDIARRVVGAAAAKLTGFEQERVLTKPTSSLAAYEYLLRGRDRTVNATREQNDASREMFQRAIDLDPTYAAAYAALGGTYFDAVVSGWTEFRDEEVERAEALAQKALALDPATTSAYRLLAATHLYRGRYDLALGQIDRALEINPSDAESYAYRGYILVYAGKSGEAVPWLEGALRFDRANTRASMYIGTAYYFLDRYDKAIEACDRTLARNPGRSTQLNAHAILAASYAAIGKSQNAEGERAIVARLSPFFDAERFAAQFATPEARDHMLEGLKKAGFR
jgi:adenylate cyclase